MYNKAKFDFARNQVQHDRTKNMKVDRHFIKVKLSDKQICMPMSPLEIS